MINIACVKVGNKYSSEYVNILFDMVRRNLIEGTPGKFICFTDDAEGLNEGIEVRSVPSDLAGWWAKLYLFSSEAFAEGERVIYFDLDVVITGALEPLLDYSGNFAALRDNGVEGQINSSIMLWSAGKVNQIWDEWVTQGKPKLVSSDQVWIGNLLPHIDILQYLYPEKFYSFKLECLNEKTPPKGAMVVYFHGEPRPHQCNIEWVKNVWKIGGGTADDLLMVCNTEVEKIKSNIRAACKKDVLWIAQLPQHFGHAVIVGGAPSLKNHIEQIREMALAGHAIFATNNTVKFLLENGITPRYQVIVDARESNSAFIQEDGPGESVLLASQCHPSVFDAAQERHNVKLWHCLTPEIDGAIENPDGKQECIIACGSTVGLSSMGLAFTLGYRVLHLFGMDSCYSDGVHHAYAQPANDSEIVLEARCYGRTFKASAWMLHQANQFQELAGILMAEDCTIVVHGTGLIPWIALNSQKQTEVKPELPDIELIDGVWWPTNDVGTRPNVLTTLGNHTDLLIGMTINREVVIQAGGNVGLWAKEFANYFDTVFTFEPDETNFECLQRNTTDILNIVAYNAALGDKLGKKGLNRVSNSCGAHSITEGDEFEVMTIDGLNLDRCDMIQLDIEGYELFALKGGVKTIDRFHPVICLELKSTGLKYGIEDNEVISWLRDHGYQEALKMGRDVVFTATQKETWTISKQNSIAA